MHQASTPTKRKDANMRYNIRSLETMKAQLQDWVEQTDTTLDNENDRDYPNDDRIGALEERQEALQGALDALEEIAG